MAETRCVSVGGVSATTSLEDVVRVSNGSRIEFEAGTLERLKKHTAKEPPLHSPETDPVPTSTPLGTLALPKAACRASLFLRVVTLLRNKNASGPELVSKLQSYLNDSAEEAGVTADCYDALVLEALLDKALQVPLGAEERAVFCSGTCVSAGVAALSLHAGRRLVTVAHGIACLSCEALGASIKTFEAQRMESHGNKNAQESAEVMRTLLSGSKRVNSKKLGAGTVKGVCDVPLVHGSLMDALGSLQLTLRPEMNAQALDAKALEDFPPDLSLTFFSSLAALTKSLVATVGLSVKRMQLLVDRLPNLMHLQEGPEVPPTPERRLERLKVLQAVMQSHLQNLVDKFGSIKEMLSGVMQLEEDGLPGAGVALVGYEVSALALRALSVECVMSLFSLIILEGPPPPPSDPAVDAALQGKKEKKKKGGGLILGQGVIAVRRFFQDHLPSPVPQWPEILDSDECINSWVSACHQLLSMDSRKLPEVVQVIQQQVEMHQVRRKPKIPKGARDFLPDQMRIRETVFQKITAVFKRHGAVSIDTPVFELKETLTGKYGEDSKLIYDLADQGGEILSLRYDLTVPFARYVALNSVGNIKRYHIGKVYRRDQPQMTKGRFREFFQCDFDVAGSYSVMVPDAECVKVLVEILQELELGEFEVKVNHRRLIDAMMDICGVPAAKHRAICSAIDKLDKEPWEAVKSEMVVEKGLDSEVADKLGAFVQLRDTPQALLAKLTASNHPFMLNADTAAALKEMEVLIGYLESMQALESVVFDLSLARGLDYYSGLIYEATCKGAATGSVAAGGRYDKLVGMFSGKDVPAVGVSIGVERVFSIMEKHMKESAQNEGTAIRSNDTQVLVASIGNGMQRRRMEICCRLWSAGIAAEFGYKPNPKMADNFDYALQEGIPFMVLFGEDELKQEVVKVKDLAARTEDVVSDAELITELSKRLKG